ncbi:hypothetical protein GA0115246_113131, partial [Streptomyces sp. SolWspMP-sol7th]
KRPAASLPATEGPGSDRPAGVPGTAPGEADGRMDRVDAVTENLPAVFAGAVFLLFGGCLLVWTCVRIALGVPVAEGARTGTAAALALLFSVSSLGLGLWCFGRI